MIDLEIDWPCRIEKLYSDVNQGCRLGVSRAITWFFEQVEEGIILEDDCVPHPDFFYYCTNLLERYRHDTRVWCISGNTSRTVNGVVMVVIISAVIIIAGDGRVGAVVGKIDSELVQWPKLRELGFMDSILVLWNVKDPSIYGMTFMCIISLIAGPFAGHLAA